MPIDAIAGRAELLRLKRLERARRDKMFLATEILGYGWNPKAAGDPFPGKGLTEEFHGKVFKWWEHNDDELCIAITYPRWHHKTTMIVTDIVQQILIDPCGTQGYFHAVDKLAQMLNSEVAYHVQTNKKLRALDPVGVDEEGKPYRVFPAHNNKRFASADRLTVNRHKFSKFPTLFCAGAGSEITGMHMGRAYIDDIIGRNTIEDSGLPKIESWFQNTLMPVVDDAILRAFFTRWHSDAVYEKWLKSKHWASLNLPCAVTEEFDFISDPSKVDWTKKKIYLPPDKKFTCPIYGPLDYRDTQRKKLEHFEREMGPDFDPQMNNDPSPPGEKPWDRETCEHYIPMKEAEGEGAIIILSDPAPAKTGSLDGRGAKTRGDGSKDDWATCVVKVRRRKQRREVILLDGKWSKDWDVDAGFDVICDLKSKWRTKRHAVEATGQAIALYENTHRQAARRAGVAFSPVVLKGTYRGNAKNAYFAALSSMAKNDEFLICAETCDKAFLDKFLEQAREWRPTQSGGNSLRFDDCANVVSFATDPAVISLAQAVSEEFTLSPFKVPDNEDEFAGGSRYVRF